MDSYSYLLYLSNDLLDLTILFSKVVELFKTNEFVGYRNAD